MSTKTIDATTLRNNLSAMLKSHKKDDILFIRKRGKLTGKAIIDDELLEDILLLSDKKYLAKIRRSREEVKRGEVYSFEEVFGDVL